MNPSPYLVLGLGRPFCGDEGIGALVITALLNTVAHDVELAHAEHFEALDASEFTGRRKVVIVAPREDGGEPAGTMWLLNVGPAGPRPVNAERNRCEAKLWFHLDNALRRARESGAGPDEVVVLSIQVGRCEHGTTPAAPLRAMVSILKRLVRFEIRAARDRHRALQVVSRHSRPMDVTGPPIPLAVVS